MANFYTDNEDIKFHLGHPLMEKIVALKERNYTEAQQYIDVINQAGLNGISLPRKYNGLNFPITPFIMAAEIVARADAGLQNIWGLQDCAETINEFASDEQKAKYLPRVCAGETCAMDLTEPTYRPYS